MFADFHAKRIAGNELRAAHAMLRLWEGKRAVAPRFSPAWKRAVKGIEAAYERIATFTEAILCEHEWRHRPSTFDPFICKHCALVIPYEDASRRPISTSYKKETP